MWLWLIFGGIFAAFGISTFLSAIGSAGLIGTLRFIVALVFLMISVLYFRYAWNAYRDSRTPKE
jgi:predicted permease